MRTRVPQLAGRAVGASPSWLAPTSTATCRLDFRNIDLPHRHHRVECAFGGSRITIRDCLRQRDWRDLPGDSPFVLAPAARALLAPVSNDRVPILVRFGLIDGRNLERQRFVSL